ncbi:MAG: outer membrane exchange protein TraA family protein [Polyangia bacterium]
MQPQIFPERAALRRGTVAGRCWLTLLLTLWGLTFGAAQSASAQKLPPVTVTGDPVAPNPRDSKGNIAPGTGLCSAFRLVGAGADPTMIFKPRGAGFPNSGTTDFPDSVNAFMDGMTGGPMSGARVDITMLSPFDLTNFVDLPGLDSKGDFISTRNCPSYMGKDNGCWFPGAPQDTTILQNPFGSRFRGFINILPEWVNQGIHFGFYTDDAVAMYIYTKAKPPSGPDAKLVISRGISGPYSKYRVTNLVYFKKAGLYPIEITYAQYLQNAVLEMVVLFDSSFTDIDEVVNLGTSPLGTYRFALDYTQPTQFFQTASGVLPFDGQPNRCKQCPRSLANIPNQPSGTCDPGMFCNEAAVCAPCIGDQFCGKSCKECLAPEPFCIRDPRDPGGDYQCAECRDDMDCTAGRKCLQGKCVNPCNCCPGQFCIPTDPSKPDVRNCSQCRTDTDCGAGKCDLLNGRCIDKIPDCNTDDRCGKSCVSCPDSTKNDPQGVRPFCLNGEVCVQCRYDADCKVGTFCRSGDCVPCSDDRHCGPNCKTCGIDYVIASDGTISSKPPTDKPFCYTPDNRVDTATCVRCRNDKDCGEGGTCDATTHQCSNTCATPCPPNQVCSGGKCVECFTNAQCPCGICVDGTCTPNCESSSDCLGTQCCSKDTKTCISGRCKPGLTAHGGALCCSGTQVGSTDDPIAPGPNRGLWMGSLLTLLLLGWSTLRKVRS